MGQNWRISWRDERDLSDRRGSMFVTAADQDEIDERVALMKDFPTITDVQAEVIPDSEWEAVLADQTAFIAPTHRIV